MRIKCFRTSTRCLMSVSSRILAHTKDVSCVDRRMREVIFGARNTASAFDQAPLKNSFGVIEVNIS